MYCGIISLFVLCVVLRTPAMILSYCLRTLAHASVASRQPSDPQTDASVPRLRCRTHPRRTIDHYTTARAQPVHSLNARNILYSATS